MQLSVLLSSLPFDFEKATDQVASLGFENVDVVAVVDRDPADLEALAASGLTVCCASIGRDLPEGESLEAEDLTLRRQAVEAMKRQIADAARLGATHAYVVPGFDRSAEALARYGECCDLLAGFAEQRMIQLCVEHFPGRSLDTVAKTVDWIRREHPSLKLLLDVGHCLISDEDPADAAKQAGDGLGYVHLDDNDGVQDLHWPLYTGVLRREVLRQLLVQLEQMGFAGALSLELNPHNANPVGALVEGKAAVEEARAWRHE